MPGQDLSAAGLVVGVKSIISRAEARWFDWTRSVNTQVSVTLDGAAIKWDDAYEYLPSRAATTRMAINALPIRNYQDYDFIDFGSGKGKVLLIAAEYPFRRVEGIEFSGELHKAAAANICTYRSRRRKCFDITSVNINAIDYQFPDDDCVLYFFNPFGLRTMQGVLRNLARSLTACPRDVFVILAYPELAPIFRDLPQMKPVLENRRVAIFRSRLIHSV